MNSLTSDQTTQLMLFSTIYKKKEYVELIIKYSKPILTPLKPLLLTILEILNVPTVIKMLNSIYMNLKKMKEDGSVVVESWTVLVWKM